MMISNLLFLILSLGLDSLYTGRLNQERTKKWLVLFHRHPAAPCPKADTVVCTINSYWSWKFGQCWVFTALLVPALLPKAVSVALRHSGFCLTVCDDEICFRLCLPCLCKINSQTWAWQNASWSSANLSLPLAQRNSEIISVTTK